MRSCRRRTPLPDEAWLPRAISTAAPPEDEANSDEQDETIVRSVPSVLLQGTATTRNSLTTIAAVSTGRTTLRCQERGGVPEMSTKLIVKIHSALPALIAHPAVAEFGAGAGRQLTQQPESPERLRREDQGLRRPYPGCGPQFGCVIA